MSVKSIGTVREETETNIQTNTTNQVSGDEVQEAVVNTLDSLAQSNWLDTLSYEAGESKIFTDGKLYLCLSGTTPGESPTTNSEKWQYAPTGIMQVAKAEVLYTNIDQTIIITLPENAVIWDVLIEVVTLFNDSGTDNIVVGTTGDPDYYVTSIDETNLFFRGLLDYAMGATNKIIGLAPLRDKISASTNITFQYTGANSDATAGQAYVYIHYSLH